MNAYYVTKDKKPCQLIKNGLHSRGVLVPCPEGTEPTIMGYNFGSGKKKAERAIARTLKVADRLRKSILSEWEKVSGIVQSGTFAIAKRKADKSECPVKAE